MSRATAKMRDIAARLIAYESGGNAASGPGKPPALLVIENLSPRLATLMGNIGLRSLLSRAIAMAQEEFLWLRAVHVKSNGTLSGLDELRTQVDPQELAEGSVVLIAQVLGQLAAFIGEDLMLQIVKDAWSTPGLDDLNSLASDIK